jgi:hypothetical protein
MLLRCLCGEKADKMAAKRERVCRGSFLAGQRVRAEAGRNKQKANGRARRIRRPCAGARRGLEREREREREREEVLAAVAGQIHWAPPATRRL